jgi:hypothetical protein
MERLNYRDCEFGDTLPALAFCPPDSPSHGPILEAWTFHGAQHVKDSVVFYFKRTHKGGSWFRAPWTPMEIFEHMTNLPAHEGIVIRPISS